MQFDSHCSQCIINRECTLARKHFAPEVAHKYILDVLQVIHDAPAGVSAPFLIPLLGELLDKYGVTGDLYAGEKAASNAFAMKMLPKAKEVIAASENPLLTALKYAQAGNFMDFGVLGKEDIEAHLTKAAEDAVNIPLDEMEFRNFVRELQEAKSLLIIGDNAGEIALDTLLVEELKKAFPTLGITYAVRGGNCLNDATRADAELVGMTKLCPVIDNGCRIPGTELGYIGEEMKSAIASADVILAKGQANFETLATSGYNIYFNFLCKCERLQKMLKAEKFSGQFLAERRLPPLSAFPE